MFRAIIRRLTKRVRFAPPAAKATATGYHVTVNGYIFRWEPTWKKAYKCMRNLQRKGLGGWRVEMRGLKLPK